MTNIPTTDNQQFSDQTLKGFLLKNIDPSTQQDPAVQILNQYLVKRVDNFWDQVIIPLRNAKEFDGNKVNYYFELYKEGLEARRVLANPFPFLSVSDDKIKEIRSKFGSVSDTLKSGE